MRRWWTEKYQKSHQSDEFKRYTLSALLVEFFEDYYAKHPAKVRELDLPFLSTGDPMIDKWEREIAAGITPDLMEDLTPEDGERLMRWSRAAYQKKMSGEINLMDSFGDSESFEEEEVHRETF